MFGQLRNQFVRSTVSNEKLKHKINCYGYAVPPPKHLASRNEHIE